MSATPGVRIWLWCGSESENDRVQKGGYRRNVARLRAFRIGGGLIAWPRCKTRDYRRVRVEPGGPSLRREFVGRRRGITAEKRVVAAAVPDLSPEALLRRRRLLRARGLTAAGPRLRSRARAVDDRLQRDAAAAADAQSDPMCARECQPKTRQNDNCDSHELPEPPLRSTDQRIQVPYIIAQQHSFVQNAARPRSAAPPWPRESLQILGLSGFVSARCSGRSPPLPHHVRTRETSRSRSTMSIRPDASRVPDEAAHADNSLVSSWARRTPGASAPGVRLYPGSVTRAGGPPLSILHANPSQATLGLDAGLALRPRRCYHPHATAGFEKPSRRSPDALAR